MDAPRASMDTPRASVDTSRAFEAPAGASPAGLRAWAKTAGEDEDVMLRTAAGAMARAESRLRSEKRAPLGVGCSGSVKRKA